MKDDTKKTLEAALRAGGCPDCPSCGGLGRRLNPQQLDGALSALKEHGVSVTTIAHRANIAPGNMSAARTGKSYGRGVTAKVFEVPLVLLVEEYGIGAQGLADHLHWWNRPQVEEVEP